MFAGKLFVTAAAYAALAVPMSAHAGDAKVVTTAVTTSISKTAPKLAPLPAKLYLVSVDTGDCFEGGTYGSAAADFAQNCAGLMGAMPESRRIPSIKTQVAKVLCPRVTTTDADGKSKSEEVCRTSINPNKLSDYQVVGLAYQLGILR